MNKREIIERLSADEDRCKYCNSSTVYGGHIYCSASHSRDMDCDGKDFKLDYKIEEAVSAIEKQLTDKIFKNCAEDVISILQYDEKTGKEYGCIEILSKEQEEAREYLRNYSTDDNYFDEEYN